MDAKELRIDNWVKEWYNDGVISEFMELQVGAEDFEHTKDFNPIPLTKKWLLKFGAKDDGKYIGWNGLILYKRNESHAFYSVKGHNNIKLKHVHSLQNLYFALTNTELTIK